MLTWLIPFLLVGSGYNPFDWDPDDRTIRQSRLRPSLIKSGCDHSQTVVMSRIVSFPVDFQDDLWDGLPDGMDRTRPQRIVLTHVILLSARDLVAQLLIHNPKHRETVKGALLSQWIQLDVQDLKDGYRDRIGRNAEELELPK